MKPFDGGTGVALFFAFVGRRSVGFLMDRKKRYSGYGSWQKPRMQRKGKTVFPDDDRDLAPDEIEFGKAMDDYKRANRRPFPRWSEVLQVLKDLGYAKVG